MHDNREPFLRKQAWDYFSTHSSQRMSIFNFYISISSVTATTYAASWKNDSNLQSARGLLAFLLCLFAFVFWKLDQRNRALIKGAERVLKHYEASDDSELVAKVFSLEEIETNAKRSRVKGWRWLQIWNWTLSYSHCFNFVFAVFALVGITGLIGAIYPYVHVIRWFCTIRKLL
jgi:hypothetical protein